MTSEAVAGGDAARTSRSVIGRTRPRRRPSGEAPPLLRQLNRSGRFWLALAAGMLVFLLVIGLSGVVTVRLDAAEAGVLADIARLRTGPTTAVLRAIDQAIRLAVLLIWWLALAVMLFWRRWRPSDQPEMRRWERVTRVSHGYGGERHYTFTGGCITYRFDLQGSTRAEPVAAISEALGFLRRSGVAQQVHDSSDGQLELDQREGSP